MERKLIKQIKFSCRGIGKSGKIKEKSKDKYIVSVYKYPASPFAEGKYEINATCNDNLHSLPISFKISDKEEKEVIQIAEQMVDEITDSQSKKVDARKKKIDLLQERARQEKLEAAKKKEKSRI